MKNTHFVNLNESDLSKVSGGIAPALILAMYMAGYTIGKDIAKR